MYYATGFMAPDPFVYIQHGNRKIMITSDLELDRARSQSKADKVLSFLNTKGLSRREAVRLQVLSV